MTIAWLGTGLLGGGFVDALRRRGERVRAWNRSIDKARALAGGGVEAFDDPAEAVRGAERVHLTLSDDAAVDQVLERVRPSLARDALVVDHTTVAPLPTAERCRRLRAAGVAFLHAPVFMGPDNARSSTGMMLASGPRALFDRAAPHLATMTGSLEWLGERDELAAAFKLFGNAMIATIAAGFADVLTLARAVGVDPLAAQALFTRLAVGKQLEVRGKKMAEGDYRPSFELTMARKDVRLMLETAAQGGAPLAVLPAVARRQDELIAAGHGSLDLGALAIEAVPPRR